MSGDDLPRMMWNSAGRPDRLTTPPVSKTMDHFNNNPYRNNSVSQQHSTVHKVQQNSDPWNWGWEDNGSSGGQGGSGQEENELWGAQPTAHLHQPPQQQQHQINTNNTPVPNNSSDFFENIDLNSSVNTANKLFNQQPPQSRYHYSHPPPQQQHYLQQQVQPQPQISTNPSYSYFQFTEHQQNPSVNSVPLVNQYPSTASSQPQPTYTNHTVSNFPQQQQQLPQSQLQYMHMNNYQFTSSTPFSQNTVYNSSSSSNNVNSNSINNNVIAAEVENREIAPPEKIEKNLNLNQTLASSTPPPPPMVSSLSTTSINSNSSKSNIVPENQEMVPENEERPPDPNTVSSSMSNLRLSSPPPSELTGIAASSNDLQQWNSVPGWENQEVAPRFTVDRDQYLETGHLHPPPTGQSQSQQSSTTDNDVDVDTNDEGEAVPPPGLHRLVTGQGQTVGQERLVVGSPPPPPSSSSGPTGLRPQVPGHSMQQQSDLSSQPSHPPLGQRMIPGQLRDDDMERMVLGSSNSTNDNIQQPREQLQSNSVSQRTVPGGRSNDIQQSRDREQPSGDHVSQRTVPGGSSASSSSAGSNSSYSQLPDLPSEERLVLGRPTIDQGDDRLQPQQNTSGHNVIASSSSSMWTSGSGNSNHQDSVPSHQVSYAGDPDLSSQSPPRPPSNSNSIAGAAEQSRSNSLVSDPPPGLHRMVVGHPDNSSRGGSASGDEMSQIGIPPPGLHRMVLGEQQPEQKQPQPDQHQPQQCVPPQQTPQQSQSLSQGSNADNEDCDKDRDIDSDSDYRISRRKHHRRESIEDGSYVSDRERERDRRNPGPDYWERRYDDRRQQKERIHHSSYDHSPEYRSEEESERDRNDYRDHRDHYRHPPRPRDRDRERGDRRRHSPDYYYRDDDYREDQRRQGRGGRYYPPRDVYEDDYYYHHRENRSSRPSSRSGREYPRRPGGTGGPHEYMPPRSMNPYYPDQGTIQQQMQYYHLQQQYYEMRRNDPKGYAAWYERYMMDVNSKLYGQAVHHPNDSRTSVLSGRSSANHHRSSNEKVIMDDSMSSISNKGMLDSSGIPSAVPSHGSVDHRLANKEGGDAQDNSISQRYTPQLYGQGAHVKGTWSKQGQLVVVSPNYPLEGQLPIVEVMLPLLSNMQNDPDVLEFLESPGPFIVGVTHKNTVLQYLKKRADLASHNAEKLLYEYMQLVIRLNGVVDMTDVADLLMNNYNEDPGAEHDQYHQQQLQQQQYGDAIGHQDNCINSETSAQEVTDRFRDLLLQGNKTDALEWAMQNKNWGHAFFLASKMDTRSYNNVMLRFANGLPANDPLQTLYQMMSGREPQAATCCADKKWGDWRPHLAMMLSNSSGHPEVDRKSIISLGDSLASKGRLFASHFCYVTAQVEFGAYTDRSAKLVLLGSSHLQPFAQFATCRSIMLTLCYEYSKRLHKKDLSIPALQVYKYILATRLIDNGKLVLASQYLENIALDMIHRPTRQNRPLAILVAELADQITLADPALAVVGDLIDDPGWLNILKQILDDTNDTNLQTSSMSHGISTSTVSTSAADAPPIPNQVAGCYGQDQAIYDGNLHAWSQQEPQSLDSTHYPGYQTSTNHEVMEDQYAQYQQQPPLQHQLQHPHETQYHQQMPIPDAGTTMSATDYMSNSVQQHSQQPQNSNANVWNPVNSMYSPNSWQDQSQVQQQPMVTPIAPQVSSANMNATNLTQEQKSSSPEKKPNKDESSRRSGKKSKQQSSGWFGGIFDKISFRSKNEMILPDDKNPSIVWDEKKGKWVDKNADEDDEAAAVRPPPKASELPGFTNPAPVPPAPVPVSPSIVPPTYENNPLPVTTTAAPSSVPNANVLAGNGPMSMSTSGVNKFKMQRVKGMKANYIDVMNPNSNKKNITPVAVPPPLMEPVPAATAPVNNFFIPAPVEGNENAPIDFLSPSGPVSYEISHKPLDQTKELSRSSSASSLSREVSNIMSRYQTQPQSKPYKQRNRHHQNQLYGMNYSSQEPSYYNVMQGK